MRLEACIEFAGERLASYQGPTRPQLAIIVWKSPERKEVVRALCHILVLLLSRIGNHKDSPRLQRP